MPIHKILTPFAILATSISFFTALSLPVNAAHAQHDTRQAKTETNVTRTSYTICLSTAAGVTPDMKQCMGTEYAYQDNRLNKAYKTLMGTLDRDQRIKLRSDERTWITYRNSHCALDPKNGQAAELDAYDCSVQETAKQASALESQLHKDH